MKKNLYIILSLLLIACEKDATIAPKPYPIVTTNEATEVDATGATFSAKKFNTKGKDIIDFGFIVEGGGDSFKYSAFNSEDITDFSFRCKVDIGPNIIYTVQAYIASSEYFVKGNKVSFASNGSEKPEILDFSPKSGFDKTSMFIIAKNLSQFLNRNSVYLNEHQCNIKSIKNDTLFLETPTMSYFGIASFKVSNGINESVARDKFIILGPIIHSISPPAGKSGTIITIQGENLTQNGDNLSVDFGIYSTKIIEATNTSIKILTPGIGLINDNLFTVSLTNGAKKTDYNQGFLMKKSWDLKEATPFDWGWRYDAFTYNEEGYILELNTKELYSYNPQQNSWLADPSSVFPGERNERSLYIVNGDNLYKIGGMDYSNNKLKEFWVYSFISHTWQQKEDLPFSFSQATYFTLHGYSYIITSDQQVWKYDFQNETFTQMSGFPVSFEYYFAASFIANENAHVVTYGKTFQYNESNDTWEDVANNPFKKEDYSEHAIGFTYQNTGYVLQSGQDLYKYDFLSKNWFLVSAYPDYSDSYKVIFVINEKAYFAATSSHYGNGAPFLYSYEE